MTDTTSIQSKTVATASTTLAAPTATPSAAGAAWAAAFANVEPDARVMARASALAPAPTEAQVDAAVAPAATDASAPMPNNKPSWKRKLLDSETPAPKRATKSDEEGGEELSDAPPDDGRGANATPRQRRQNLWRALGASRRTRGVLEGVVNLAHRRAGGKQSYGAFRQWFVHEAPATALPLSEAEAWRCHGLAADPQLEGIVRKVFDVCMPQDRAASTALFRTMHAVLGPTSARPGGHCHWSAAL